MEISYIESIEVNTDHFCFKKGFKLDCVPGINLLVGDQGVGKSTLLSTLQKKSINERNTEWLDINLSKLAIQNGVSVQYFDSEKMNPRVQKEANSMFVVASHFCSHGEALVGVTINALNTFEKVILLSDEPESGLSIRNQLRFARKIKELASEKQCQIFVATHSSIIINEFENVYSLEHKKWMKSKNFIKSQLKIKKEE